MRRILLSLLCVAGSAACGGCYRPYQTPEQLSRGLVVVLPGIEGDGPTSEAIVQGLVRGGVNYGIDLEDWSSLPERGVNFGIPQNDREKAIEIAAKVADYRAAHPDNPVVLVGQARGGAMAIWIAEAMPEGQDVDGLILMAPSMSPAYMLESALSKTRRGIVNFYSSKHWIFSPVGWFILPTGTTTIGTMDGQRNPSAGEVGFEVPSEPGQARLYDKLYQIAWHEQMAMKSKTDAHFSSSAEVFVANYVAPLVLSQSWSKEILAK